MTGDDILTAEFARAPVTALPTNLTRMLGGARWSLHAV
jgi:hypothetical protein